LNSNSSNYYTISCKKDSLKLFITEVRYENDYDNYCYNKLVNYNNETNEEGYFDKKCYSYKKDKLSSECNGKSKCDISLNHDNNEHDLIFDEKFIGYKSCNFIAKRLIVNYECIDGKSITMIVTAIK
jgi:hypothetical protein